MYFEVNITPRYRKVETMQSSVLSKVNLTCVEPPFRIITLHLEAWKYRRVLARKKNRLSKGAGGLEPLWHLLGSKSHLLAKKVEKMLDIIGTF